MEIYVKKHEDISRLNWLSSLPSKYKEELIQKILDDKLTLDQSHHYKVVLDILQENDAQRSQIVKKFLNETEKQKMKAMLKVNDKTNRAQFEFKESDKQQVKVSFLNGK
ncbi:UNKNOWN [Stylonychia lemnae]|uniref:Uncharacterized protein n=1 Tax=Stylonychia lemnae TaxID=5949 RepID=A0A078ALT4_STYLE|nr:UNKNOWN [Stylonychia lemnae]|eukprot:CDW81808.1 UNKNOWN [Stylonychia lemnae]